MSRDMQDHVCVFFSHLAHRQDLARGHTSAQESPKKNRTNKYSTYHDEEQVETKHHTYADGYPFDYNTMFIPPARSPFN